MGLTKRGIVAALSETSGFGLTVLPDVDPFIEQLHRERNSASHALNHPKSYRATRDIYRGVARELATGLFTQKEVAERMGVSESMVSRIKDQGYMNDYIAHLRCEQDDKVLAARQILIDEAEAVARAVIEGAKDETLSWRERRHLCDSVLDRAGISRLSESKTTNVSEKHTTIDHIRRLAEESAPNPNVQAILDAEFAVVEAAPPCSADQLDFDFTASPEQFADPLLAAICAPTEGD